MMNTFEIDERIVKCRKILDVDPNSQIFAALADAYRKKGDFENAFRICQNGLKIHPSYGSAHIVMAKINLDRGLYDWAMAEAKKAAEIDGKSRTIELLLAEIYIYRGEFQAAVKLLKKLQNADPYNTQINKLLDIAQKIPAEQKAISQPSQSNIDANDEKTIMMTRSDSEKPKEQTAVVEKELTLDAQQIIEQGIRIAGVDGVLLVNKEGLVLESEWTLKIDVELCGATLGDLSLLLTQELVESSFGNFTTVLIEATGYTYYVKRVDVGLFVFVASEKSNLGSLRMKIESLLGQYQTSK